MKMGTFTFYGKYAFRTEGAIMTCCVRSMQLPKKKIKSTFKPIKKNFTELKKVLASYPPKEEDGLATYLIR